MNPTEQHINARLEAIKHEREAEWLQTQAAEKAGKGDYVCAYETLGKALAELRAANEARKQAQRYQGVSA